MMLELWGFWKFEIVWRWDRIRERIVMFFAWHCLPYRIRYWIVVRAFADASQANPHLQPDELGYDTVVRTMK
jgi:hypothetical protein